jgi:phosphate/sulfate permease
MESLAKIVGAVVLVVVIVFVLSALMAYPVQLMVNYIFTDSVRVALFGTPILGFWKAFWLTSLCGFLFKGTSSSNSKD